MHRARTTLPVALGLFLATALATGCTGLSYPEPEMQDTTAVANANATGSAPAPSSAPAPHSAPAPSSAPASAPAEPTAEAPPAQAPEAARASEAPSALDDTATSEAPRSAVAGALAAERAAYDGTDRGLGWEALAREARIDRRQGRFDTAQERLAQAAAQLADRPPYNAQRRAVHALRARLALDLLAVGRGEDAEALAETLFEEVAAGPAIGDTATADLALTLLRRREQEAARAGLGLSPVELLRVAFEATQRESPSRTRLEIAYRLSEEAGAEERWDLAWAGIRRAALDARVLEPTNLDQIASIAVYEARIAIRRGDLEVAEAAATNAYRLFEELGADDSSRLVAEATLARIAAHRGDAERTEALARASEVRIENGGVRNDHALRSGLTDLARIARLQGDAELARTRYRRALAIPANDFRPDQILVGEIRRELAGLDEARPTTDQ